MNFSGFVAELFHMWIPSKCTEIFTMMFDLKIRQKITEPEFYVETLNLRCFVTEILTLNLRCFVSKVFHNEFLEFTQVKPISEKIWCIVSCG